MSQLHHMHLNLAPFERIQNGSQKIEARVNDEKRQKVMVGDEVEFVLRDDLSKTFRAKVVELLHYKTFNDLYTSRSAEDFGGRDLDELLNSIYKYYSKDEEEKYGVVGIKLEPVSQ